MYMKLDIDGVMMTVISVYALQVEVLEGREGQVLD